LFLIVPLISLPTCEDYATLVIVFMNEGVKLTDTTVDIEEKKHLYIYFDNVVRELVVMHSVI